MAKNCCDVKSNFVIVTVESGMRDGRSATSRRKRGSVAFIELATEASVAFYIDEYALVDTKSCLFLGGEQGSCS